jgi:hypothetical protein
MVRYIMVLTGIRNCEDDIRIIFKDLLRKTNISYKSSHCLKENCTTSERFNFLHVNNKVKLAKKTLHSLRTLSLSESDEERKIVAPGKVALELVQGNVELNVLAAVEAGHLHLRQLLQDPGPAPQLGLKGLGHEISKC